MDAQTVQLLNQLNHAFYQKIGASFDSTRQQAWEGWEILLPYLQQVPPAAPLSVLDVGCGNGRFGLFLQAHLGRPFIYHGFDSDAFLLERAQASLTAAGVSAELWQQDALTDFQKPLPSYDVLVLFGLLHHIPGYENRQALLQRASALLAKEGWLIVATWAFY